MARGVSLSYTRRCFHLRYVRELYACSTNRSTSVDIKYIESCANLLACDNQGSNEKQGRFWNIRAFSEHVRSRERERYTLTKERLRIMMARHRNITTWKIVNSGFRVCVRTRCTHPTSLPYYKVDENERKHAAKVYHRVSNKDVRQIWGLSAKFRVDEVLYGLCGRKDEQGAFEDSHGYPV